MKNITVTLFPGQPITYSVAEDTALSTLVNMYKEDTGVNIGVGYDLFADGIKVVDPASVMVAGSLTAAENKDNASDDMPDMDTDVVVDEVVVVEEVISTKAKDMFTKEFVENCDAGMLKKYLLEWAIERKLKNKYIQERKAELLGQSKSIPVGSHEYKTECRMIDGLLAIRTLETTPAGDIVFSAIADETEEMLINRFNADF